MTQSIALWLNELGLGEHAGAFDENGVDFALLAELTNDDLKDLGVARLADRKRPLKAIASLDAVENQAPAMARPTEMPIGERRQVTVLFSDLTGFTQLSREIGRAHV